MTAPAATDDDWGHEYLDMIIAARVGAGYRRRDGAYPQLWLEPHRLYPDGRCATAQRFMTELDSAILMHNASTQFADGGEFGMGAEIGIATGKMHARGPVGAEQLTSFKYLVTGDGCDQVLKRQLHRIITDLNVNAPIHIRCDKR